MLYFCWKESTRKLRCEKGGIELLNYIEKCCFETATLENEEIWRIHRELEKKTGDMEFLRQDEILCLANELCCRYARNAFSEGFYTGLRLVSEIGKL